MIETIQTIERNDVPSITNKATPSNIENVPAEDTISVYFRQMAAEPLLTHDEEIELGELVQQGLSAQSRLDESTSILDAVTVDELHKQIDHGERAREKLAAANVRLVISIAKRYQGYGLPLIDLIQEGNIGLMRAVDKYDPDKGHRFSTYATWWIRQSVTRALGKKSRTIRLPLNITRDLRRMKLAEREIHQTTHRKATTEELADHLSMSPERIRDLKQQRRSPISADKPIRRDDDREMMDIIPDSDATSPEEAAEQVSLRQSIQTILGTLAPRESRILKLRYGLGDHEPHTLEEVGSKMNLSRERIRQIQKRALRQLRGTASTHELKAFWN